MFEGLFQPIHLIILLVIVLLIFGPGKLPQLGGAVGRTIKEFKQGFQDLGDTATSVTTPAHTVVNNDISTVSHSQNLADNDEYEVIERKVIRVAKAPAEVK